VVLYFHCCGDLLHESFIVRGDEGGMKWREERRVRIERHLEEKKRLKSEKAEAGGMEKE